jgi:hypothetical protein
LPLVIISLTLTMCSGLQAIAFWALRGDFAIDWWLINGFLFGYPLAFLPMLIGTLRRWLRKPHATN